MNKWEQKFNEFGTMVRSGAITTRPAYSLSMAHAVYQAMCCGLNNISAIELGVAQGRGLKELVSIAQYLQKEFQVQIEVIGFDTGHGLPALQDYRDHPEIWHQGEFQMGDAVMPAGVQLIVGDVKDTIQEFIKHYQGCIGFVSIDLDLYSSTKAAWPLFEMPAHRYLPAMPVYVDDINVSITYNPWCGEALALTEFNQCHRMRKFEEKNKDWKIQNFHVFHVLDHDFRSGAKTPPYPLTIQPF
jgi:hypothetical protein